MNLFSLLLAFDVELFAEIFTIVLLSIFFVFVCVFMCYSFVKKRKNNIKNSEKLSKDRKISNNDAVITVYSDKSKNYSKTENLPIPKRMSTKDFSYEFAGWDKNYIDENGNTIVKAIFIERPNEVYQEENNSSVLNQAFEIDNENQSLTTNENLEKIEENEPNVANQFDEDNSNSIENTDEKISENLNIEEYNDVSNSSEIIENNEDNNGYENLVEENIFDTDIDKTELERVSEEDFYTNNIDEATLNESLPEILEEKTDETLNDITEISLKSQKEEKKLEEINMGIIPPRSSSRVGTTRNNNGFKDDIHDNLPKKISIDVDTKKTSIESEDIFKRLGVNMIQSRPIVKTNPKTTNEKVTQNIIDSSAISGPFKNRKMEIMRANAESNGGVASESQTNYQQSSSKTTSTEEFLTSTMLVSHRKSVRK